MTSLMGRWLSDLGKYSPDGLAFIYGDKRTTWKGLNERVNSLANALWDLGIRKGDKVTLMFHNCTEFVETTYAIQKIGAIPVPINYRFVPKEIEYQTNNSDSIAYVFEDIWLDAVEEARPNLKKVKNYICFRRTGKEMAEDISDYEGLVGRYPTSEPPEVDVRWDDTCVIIYTGGTTGLPKGVVLTWDNHREMVNNMFSVLPYFIPEIKLPMGMGAKVKRLIPIPGLDLGIDWLVALTERESIARVLSNSSLQKFSTSFIRVLLDGMMRTSIIRPIAGPITAGLNIKWLWAGFQLFHDAYFPNMMLGPILGISWSWLFPEMVSFSPEKVMEMLDREKPLFFSNTPTAWKKVLDHLDSVEFDKYDRSSVMILVTGGGVNPAKMKERMLKYFPGAIIWDIFGQTEMTPAATFRFDTARGKLKDRSVGRPIQETRIVNEKGEDVKPGEIGEILYRGGAVMKEYYKDAGKTSGVMKGGWFHSGDFGHIDEDGEIRLVGRGSECINTGGEKVYADELEHILDEHPKIERVCVFGVPDETWGEAIRTVLQLKEGESAREEEIRDWCRGKMVGYKIPKSVLFAEDLPVTAVGKVLKRKVKEKYGGK